MVVSCCPSVMPVTLSHAQELIQCPKEFLIRGTKDGDVKHWEAGKERHGNQPTATFRCRLRESSGIPPGLWFHAIVWPRWPSTVTISMAIDIPGVRGTKTLYRLEVDPSSTHTNRGNCAQYANRFFATGESHEHSLIYNVDDPKLLISDLGSPCAVPVVEPLESFETALNFACARLNIRNTEEFPPPNLQLPLV